MTVGVLIEKLQDYAMKYGEDTYVTLANDREIFGDAEAVGMDGMYGDIIISTAW